MRDGHCEGGHCEGRGLVAGLSEGRGLVHCDDRCIVSQEVIVRGGA